MRLLILAIVCGGCPGIEAMPEPAPELPPAPAIDEPLPPSNCARGTAPPITWCRERREGYSTASASQSSSGPRYIQDWSNGTSSGHVETLYGDGFAIERHEVGTFASQMTTVCDEQGRVSIEHSKFAATRIYFDPANRPLSNERDENFDGVFEYRNFYTYDPAGRLVRDAHDRGPGTPIDRVFLYDYDAAGRRSTSTIDLEGDGDVDAWTLHTWDALDRETMQEYFEHGELVSRWRWTFDGPRPLATEIEGNYRWTNSYDERGRMTGVESRDLVTDTIDAISINTFDELDRMIDSVVDDGLDGTIDDHIVWDYCR